MTKSTGAMALRRRREDLCRAEYSLRRMLLHIMSSIAWACYLKNDAERQAQSDAFDVVREAYRQVVAEQKDVT
jgi:hypothetical protein